eukprot:14250109-Heterocapsa_arctica.AAC.2
MPTLYLRTLVPFPASPPQWHPQGFSPCPPGRASMRDSHATAMTRRIPGHPRLRHPLPRRSATLTSARPWAADIIGNQSIALPTAGHRPCTRQQGSALPWVPLFAVLHPPLLPLHAALLRPAHFSGSGNRWVTQPATADHHALQHLPCRLRHPLQPHARVAGATANTPPA